MQDKYKVMGHIYGLLSDLYSGKSIRDCRIAMLDHIKPGDRVLFAGVGYGEDAIHAAQRGANVTIVELSETMLSKFKQNLESLGKNVTIRQVHNDILKFEEFEQYDMVVSNFFLNIFDHASMLTVLQHMVKLAKPGAKVVIGDFIYPSGNLVARAAKNAYWFAANIFFWILAKNPIHKVYNYPEIMSSIGLVVKEKRYFDLLKVTFFWSVLAHKPT